MDLFSVLFYQILQLKMIFCTKIQCYSIILIVRVTHKLFMFGPKSIKELQRYKEEISNKVPFSSHKGFASKFHHQSVSSSSSSIFSFSEKTKQRFVSSSFGRRVLKVIFFFNSSKPKTHVRVRSDFYSKK